MDMPTAYSYRPSVKSDRSDELINTHVVRPLAGLIVRALYFTACTPNQITVAAIVVGLVAAPFYSEGSLQATVIAGCLVWLKDLLDSADGQLARAKGLYSRRGRFLDSIGDFFVNLAVFTAIAAHMAERIGSPGALWLGAACFAGTTLRISYHVFYQVSFLHREDTYAINRTNEKILDADRRQETLTITLQKIYLVLYGWQDRVMAGLDLWCRKSLSEKSELAWYRDPVGLTLSGFLGMGTELFALALFSWMNRLTWYFFFNLIVQNGIWFACLVYRRMILARRLRSI